MKSYLPKNVYDLKAVEHLKSLPFDAVRSDVPILLEWIQDMHWDIAGGVASYLAPHVNEIKGELLSILEANDEIWKFNVIRSLTAYTPDKLDPDLVKIIRRIAESPTEAEIEDMVYDAAKDVLANKFLVDRNEFD